MANLPSFGGGSPFGINPFGGTGHMGLGGLFRSMFGDLTMSSFPVDVHDEGDRYEIDAELPGLHREMIKVEAKGGVLTISADMDQETETKKDDYVIHERRAGTMSRSFPIGDVKEDDITATYQDGILKVILPKGQDDDAGKRTIQID